MHNRAAHELIHDPFRNKGTAFTHEERRALNLEGLLPPLVDTLEGQSQRQKAQLVAEPTDLERYILLSGLQDRNRTLFYHVLCSDPEQYLPIVYTPTVGEACEKFGHILRKAHGVYLPVTAKGHIKKWLRNWFHQDIRFIVVTDGSRILGLGDLGASGMGIPIGKLALYTACAGVPPQSTLPICLDVGTDNEEFLKDPLYAGLRQTRVDDDVYYEFVDEFVQAVQDLFPKCCIQFEDFSMNHASPLLQKYRDEVCCFNDDIQGTAGVALAGIHAACRAKNEKIEDQRILFLGAGSAGTGIAELIVESIVRRAGISREEAMERVRLFDVNGLLVSSRTDLASFQQPFAADVPACDDFVQAIHDFKPTGIIGVSTVAGAFNEKVIRAMAEINERPLIFPYSNPTSRAECTAEQAYTWTDERVLFGSGTPMPPVQFQGKSIKPSQGNNVYIFPAVGMAIFATGATRVPQEAFLTAAQALAEQVPDEYLKRGQLYPSRRRIREVSLHVAAQVAQTLAELGLARHTASDWGERIDELAYVPSYETMGE
ncbi:MAG: NAD-dependent malic enzyme [Phycisphaerae bacterium]|jgi:malate dehydrogenase (oxaloacetate-decarboxylating)(NADP+)|nr:NAD-dependent malic enzyme [Phycisphaerae bacterium]MBT5583212.1 NAD-dependent malic enzyme [Phycisphaerae bacterium]